MTINVYQHLLQTMAAKESAMFAERVTIVAATKLLSAINRRIIRRGLKTDGTKIGNYSEKPSYVPAKEFIVKSAFKAVGQRGFKGERVVRQYQLNSNGKRVRQRLANQRFTVVKKTPKSMYLAKGYKQLRDIQGRETAFVNLEYTGSLMNDFKLGKDGKDLVIGFTNKKESAKRKGLEKKYGTVFTASKDEVEIYNQTVKEETEQIIKEILTP